MSKVKRLTRKELTFLKIMPPKCDDECENGTYYCCMFCPKTAKCDVEEKCADTFCPILIDKVRGRIMVKGKGDE